MTDYWQRVKSLWHLFDEHDKAIDEYVRREGVDYHVDVEGRPE